MKTISVTVSIIIALALASCGASHNFSKQKYTGLKKIRTVNESTEGQFEEKVETVRFDNYEEEVNLVETTIEFDNVQVAEDEELGENEIENVAIEKEAYEDEITEVITDSKIETLKEDSSVDLKVSEKMHWWIFGLFMLTIASWLVFIVAYSVILDFLLFFSYWLLVPLTLVSLILCGNQISRSRIPKEDRDIEYKRKRFFYYLVLMANILGGMLLLTMGLLALAL